MGSGPLRAPRAPLAPSSGCRAVACHPGVSRRGAVSRFRGFSGIKLKICVQIPENMMSEHAGPINVVKGVKLRMLARILFVRVPDPARALCLPYKNHQRQANHVHTRLKSFLLSNTGGSGFEGSVTGTWSSMFFRQPCVTILRVRTHVSRQVRRAPAIVIPNEWFGSVVWGSPPPKKRNDNLLTANPKREAGGAHYGAPGRSVGARQQQAGDLVLARNFCRKLDHGVS